MRDVEPDDMLKCTQCSYSLKGVAVDGNCPECGTPIAQLVTTLRCLTRRQAVTIALRLLAVIVMMWTLMWIDGVFWLITTLLDGGGISTMLNSTMWTESTSILLPPLVRLFLAFLLWRLAPKLARIIVERDGAVFRNQQAAASLHRTHPHRCVDDHRRHRTNRAHNRGATAI
ncbi:MAG: hypothetical protein ACR2GY_08415 [Phycisphaerales bacterium]